MLTKKVHVANLNTTALDWAVAKCQQLPVILDPMGFSNDFPESSQSGFWVWDDSPKGQQKLIGGNYNPSANWHLGGEILEKMSEQEDILMSLNKQDGTKVASSQSSGLTQTGETTLIAAMRLYVANVFGDEIEIPEQLLPFISNN